jgi:hypothetical protein
MKRHWFRFGVRFLLFALLFLALAGLAVMGLWNALLPHLFGVPLIGFGQALGLLLLGRLLFGFGFRGPRGYGPRGWGQREGGYGGPRHERWRQKMEERWQALTPEQREQMRQRWESRCGGRSRGRWKEPAPEPQDPTSSSL